MERIGGVRTFRHIEVHRIIAPVELGDIQPAFVYRAVIVHGQNVQMGDAQRLHMIKTRGNAAGSFRAFFDQTQIFALLLNSGTFVNGQVTDMKFINDCIGHAQIRIGIGVIFPTFRIGSCKIDDHGTLTVDTGGAGIRIAGFYGASVHIHKVGIVNTVQIALFCDEPCTVNVRSHFNLLDQIVCAFGAAFVEIQLDIGSGGSPQAEGCCFGSPYCSQIITVVSIFCFKFCRREIICHHNQILLIENLVLCESIA